MQADDFYSYQLVHLEGTVKLIELPIEEKHVPNVFLDATLIRMVLVPATMSLVGRANWWLPGWLDRILPHLDLEGAPEPLPTPAGDEDEKELIGAPS